MSAKNLAAAAWRAVNVPVTPRESATISAASFAVLAATLGTLAPSAAVQPHPAGALLQPAVLRTVATVLDFDKRARFAVGTADAKRFKQLNSYYVGKSAVGKVDWDHVDLAKNVELMWARKARTFKVTPATAKSVAGIVARYRATPHQTTTLPAYARTADNVVNAARSGVDWPGLCNRYRVSSDRCVRLQYLAGRIDGRMMVAYAMTELFTSRRGETNAQLMDMMLRKAGVDFLNVTPAIGDRFLSMGPYQFTSYAVRHDASGRQGANCVAEYGKYPIAGSVLGLTPRQQHAAAFYFATYNMIRMVNSLSPRQYATLAKRSPISRADLTVFMATSHHAPGKALGSVRAWLQAGGKPGELAKFQRGDNRGYAAKSRANLAAL